MEREKTDATVTATTDQGTGSEWVCLRLCSTACTVAMKCCSSERMDAPPLACRVPSIAEEDDAQCWLTHAAAETAHLLMACGGVRLVVSLNFCFFADIGDCRMRMLTKSYICLEIYMYIYGYGLASVFTHIHL